MAISNRIMKQRLMSLVIGGSITAPTPGTIDISKYTWSILADKLIIQCHWKQSTSGSNGSGVYLFPLPPGFTINHNFVTYSGDLTYTDVGALGGALASAGATVRTVVPIAFDATNLALLDGVGGRIGSSNFAMGNADLRYFFTAIVPVNELT